MPNSRNQTERRPEDNEGAGRGENDHQKTVQGKNQRGPEDKVGRDVGRGNQGSKGQNARPARPNGFVGSHKPGGDGPGTKTFKHDHDDNRGNT